MRTHVSVASCSLEWPRYSKAVKHAVRSPKTKFTLRPSAVFHHTSFPMRAHKLHRSRGGEGEIIDGVVRSMRLPTDTFPADRILDTTMITVLLSLREKVRVSMLIEEF